MSSFNPFCSLPSAVASYLPSSLSCPPPPSYLSRAYSWVISPLSSTYTALRTMLDALVSLPVLSVLLIPTLTSYSTTLNLLFFYLTWSTLVLSHPPLHVELVGTLGVRIFFYVLPSSLFLAFDALIPSAAETLKAQGDSGLPLKNASRKRALRLLRILGWSMLNVLVGVLLQSLTEILLTRVLAVRSALRVTTTLPLPVGIVKDVARGYLLREILTYTVHRYILHESSNPLARAHDSWYHSLPAPFPLSASYDFPLAYVVRSFIPTFAPAFIFRFHLLTYLIYQALTSLEETFAYSGYSTVPTNFILGGIARRTDAHLLCRGEGNYGCWGLMDWVTGTSLETDVRDDIEQEAERDHVVAKAARAKGLAKKKINAKVRRRRGSGSEESPAPTKTRRRTRYSGTGDT